MEAPKNDDDDFPEELDSFELDAAGSPTKIGIALGSSGGTGVKAANQNKSPSDKAQATSLVLEGKEEKIEGATVNGIAKPAETPSKAKKNACCTLF